MNINDREKVARGINLCAKSVVDENECKDCPYFGRHFCCHELMEDCRDLINEFMEEPRVLTWEELWAEDHPRTVWFEDRVCSDNIIKARYDFENACYRGDEKDYWIDNTEENQRNYGKFPEYRAWSKEPTERQRKEVEWDD